jgi:tRNA isopentenyl-2-thiomethyl-A-37 hydroxylase MiaE
MTKELTRKLVTCIAIEATSADIYHTLSLTFHEARRFWAGLEESEKRHVKILLAAGGYHLNGLMPEYIVPPSLSEIDETYRLVNETKKRVDGRALSLRDALRLALLMENAVGERYLQEVMKREEDTAVITDLRRIYADEKLHSEMISDFMENRKQG